MEIHQLEYFLAVEKYKNFSAASLEICISQSTLSQQIKKLEHELGVKLFVRYPRSVRLTPAGQDFIVHAKRIVAEIRLSQETVQKYTNLEKGYIKIGVIPNIEYLGMSKLIINFIRSYPGIQVDIHTGHTDELLSELKEKKVHAAFINSPFTGDYDIDFQPFASDRLVLLVSVSHPLAVKAMVDLNALEHEKFLLVKTSSWIRNALIDACEEAGFKPNIMLDSGHVEMVRSFVEEGIGVSLMGYRVAQNICNANTAIVAIKQIVERRTGLAIPKYSSRPPLATDVFKRFVINEMLTSKPTD